MKDKHDNVVEKIEFITMKKESNMRETRKKVVKKYSPLQQRRIQKRRRSTKKLSKKWILWG